MIEEPLPLVFASSVERPPSELVERFRAPTSFIVDALNGAVALISDNYAVELHDKPLAPGQCAMLPLHQHCMFKTGVNLGEIWRLSELADWLRANNRSRFLLTAPPLRLPGAVGSPATPVATV